MHLNYKTVLIILLLLLTCTLICAISFGAVSISPGEMLSACMHLIKGDSLSGVHENVFIQLRLPRVLLCGVTGSILAVSGVMMQGLFRNPIY